jgi:hypothetical protein
MNHRELLAVFVATVLTPVVYGQQPGDAAGPQQPVQRLDVVGPRLSDPFDGLAAAVAVQGKYAYVGLGRRLVVVEVSDPRRPTVVGHAGFWPEDPFWAANNVSAIAVSGKHAYVVYDLHSHHADVGAKNHDMVVFDVSHPAAPAVVASYHIPQVQQKIPHGILFLPVRAFTVAVSGQYAYLYHNYGLEVVDVSRPTEPRHVGSWASHADSSWGGQPVWSPRPGGGNESLGQVRAGGPHVDVAGNYAYVADRTGGLRVVDVSDPRAPNEVGSCPTRFTTRSVAVGGKRAFVIDGGRYLRVIDLSNPKRPEEIGSFDTHFRNSAGAQGVAVAGSFAYVYGIPRSFDFGGPGLLGGLQVVDVSDPKVPKEVHPGPGQPPGVVGPVLALALQGNYAYMGVGRRLEVADLSDPKRPAVIGSTELFPCSLTGVAVAGDHAFVASERGLRVVDVSDVTAPKEISSFRTAEPIWAVSLAGKSAFASGQGVLHVLDVSDPTTPRQVTAYHTGALVPQVATVGKYACVTDWLSDARDGSGRTTVRVLDLSDLAAPREVGIYERQPHTVGDTLRLAAAGDKLLVFGRQPAGLRVVDLSDLAWVPRLPYLAAFAVLASLGLALLLFRFRRSPHRYLMLLALIVVGMALGALWLVPRAPREVGHYDPPGTVQALAVADHYVYLVGVVASRVDVKGHRPQERTSFLWVVDLSNPASPRETGSCKLSDWGQAEEVTIAGKYAFVADGGNGLRVVDVSDPAAPKVIGSDQTPGYNRAVAVAGRYAFIAGGRSGLRLLDISIPAAPKRVGFYDSPLASP